MWCFASWTWLPGSKSRDQGIAASLEHLCVYCPHGAWVSRGRDSMRSGYSFKCPNSAEIQHFVIELESDRLIDRLDRADSESNQIQHVASGYRLIGGGGKKRTHDP